jgi:uncharacterized protein
MNRTNAIGWFDLYVEDLERAAAFYESVFQLKLPVMGDPTGETVMRAFPADMTTYGASGALVKSPYGRPGIGGSLLYFSVDDCAIASARVVSAHGIIVREKFSIGDFGWVALCQDTEGNLFGLNSRH